MGALRKIVDESGVSVIVATHDPLLIGIGDRVLELCDGELAGAPDELARSASW